MAAFSSIPALLTAAKACAAACVVSLAPGTYADRLFTHDFNPAFPVTLDLGQATVAGGVQFYGSSNLIVKGGVFVDAQNNAITVMNDHDIQVIGPHCLRPGNACIAVVNSAQVVVDGFVVTNSRSDGVDVAASQHVVVRNGRCEAPEPGPGAHPDCVQGWSTAAVRLTDLTISGNVSEGDTQGFTVFTHPERELAPDHIVITGNRSAQRKFANCVAANAATHVEVHHNICTTLPGAPNPVQVYLGGAKGVLGPNRLDGHDRR